ncbi:MAG: AlpA family phage regulatory protein [Proteobacteria bacterium]|nr:AlpA family phage regulatory protein [Pseudomonadota bacterium]
MQTLNTYNALPETGLVRLSQILGDKKKGIPPIIPVSKSTWWDGVKSGRFPKPIKLGERTTCWNVLDIRQLINKSEA